MSISAYARHRGCSRQAVYKALGERRIVREADGTIDPVKADAQWLANTIPTMRWAGGEDVELSPAELDRICRG